MGKKTKGRKGRFGELDLPVSRRYLTPVSGRRLLAIGALAAAAVVVVALVDLLLLEGRLVSDGPLSSQHAAFERECSACHAAGERQATAEKCSVCHEKFGDQLGVYTWAAHYLYRSDDFRRLEPSEREVPCFACHPEHEGRAAEITRVADRRCRSCHPFGSFARGHPEFDFAETATEPAALRFPHVHHVREVMKREQLQDVERSCLYCHNPRSDGRGFEAIDFDRHCDACHLNATTSTPPLPVRRSGDKESPAVETLEAIVARRGPGTRWALFTNPGEFRVRGGSVSKTPVYHRDPWILENLRLLRRSVYKDAGLADLLVASAEAPAREQRILYQEALSTLEEQAAGLRGNPEPQIQEELGRIDTLLRALRRKLENPYEPLDETRFLLALERRGSDLDDRREAEVEALAEELTEPCRNCHEVRQLTFARVQKNQRVLYRAEFNHRAHIVQRRCLDCHTGIPVLDHLASAEAPGPELDRAEIQNLPRIETCRGCHNPELTSDRCITCHYFHPDKSRRSDLLLYLE